MAKHGGHVLCSDRCAHQRWVKRGRKPADPVVARCLHCGAAFVRVNPKRRYCSRTCQSRACSARNWRRYRAEKPEVHRRISRDWARRNRDRMNAQYRAWAKRSPDKVRARMQRRRGRQRGAEGEFTDAEWKALVAAHDARCAYCGASVPLTVDHRIPLFRGGSNYIANILPACIRCNKRKACRTEEEFRAEIALHRGLDLGTPSPQTGPAMRVGRRGN